MYGNKIAYTVLANVYVSATRLVHHELCNANVQPIRYTGAQNVFSLWSNHSKFHLDDFWDK